MDSSNYHPDRWRDEVLEEVLRAMARHPELNKALTFKGARVLKQRLGRGRSSLDVDSSFSAEFTAEHPSREQQIAFIRENFEQALTSYFNSMDVVRYTVQRIDVRPRPRAESPFGWNGVKIMLTVADGELAGIENLPNLEIEVSSTEKYDDHSIAKMPLDGTEVNAYTLERCVGEKFRAYLSSTATYRQKIGRPEAMALRVKDLYDIALAMRDKPISSNEDLWSRVALLSTLVTRREQFHSVRIGETVTLLTPQVLARINSLDSMLLGKGLDPTTAHGTALTILNGQVQTQSFIMAYSESFLVVGLILLASCGALIFLPKPMKAQNAPSAG